MSTSLVLIKLFLKVCRGGISRLLSEPKQNLIVLPILCFSILLSVIRLAPTKSLKNKFFRTPKSQAFGRFHRFIVPIRHSLWVNLLVSQQASPSSSRRMDVPFLGQSQAFLLLPYGSYLF